MAAEPARQQHPEIEPEIRPRFGVIQGGGASTPRSGDLHAIDNSDSTAQDLNDQERRFGVIQGGGASTPERANLQDASKNIDKTREREQNSGWNTNLKPPESGEKDKKGATGKPKKGPIAFIIGLIFGMGGLGFAGIPLMPMALTEHMGNDTNDSNPSSQRKSLNLFGKKTNGSDFKKKLSICKGVISFRCKMKTIPQSLADQFEKEGKFKFHNKTVMPDGRIGFSALEFPDGNVANNSGDLTRILRTSKSSALAFNSMYNIKNAPYTIGDWFGKVLGGLNLTRGKKIQGETRDEARRTFQDSVRGERGTISTSATPSAAGENATEEQKRQAQAENDSGNETARQINESIASGKKLEKLPMKSGALAIPQMACITYSMANLIAATAKVKKALYFAGFAMIFLTLASSIKANAATSAEVETAMEVVAPSTYPARVEDPTTGQMIDNPNIGKNALDSEAYKVVAYGDQINLVGIATKFFVAGGFLGALQKVLTWIDKNIGKDTIKTGCKIVNSSVANVVSFLVAPVLIGISSIVTELLPLDEWAADLVNAAIDAAVGVAAGADPTTSIIGVDAGNALFIGTATIMGAASMKFGLKPGSLAAVKKNMAANQELLNEEIALKTYEASSTPLDITNRYSFLGSMAFQLASFMPNLKQPVGLSMGKLFAAMPRSLAMLTTNANAAYSMPVADYSETRFNQCKDEVYAAFKDKFKPDMFCAIRYVPHDPLDSDVVFDYQEANNQIDKITAEPIAESHTDKFVKYCVNRTDPWGSTSVAVEEQTEDSKWYTGEKCLEDTKENQMASEYVGYKIAQETIDKYPKSTESKNQQAFFDGESSTAKSNGDLSTMLSYGLSSILGEGAR